MFLLNRSKRTVQSDETHLPQRTRLRKFNKQTRRIILAVVSAAAVIAVMVVAVVLITKPHITKGEYQTAKSQLDTLSNSLSTLMSDKIKASLLSSTDVDSSFDKIKQALKSSKSDLSSFGATVAVDRDHQARTKYTAIKGAFDELDKQTSGQIANISSLTGLISDITKARDSYETDYTALASEYQNIVTKAEQLKPSDAKLQTAVSDIAAALKVDIKSLTSPEDDQSVSHDEVAQAGAKITEAGATAKQVTGSLATDLANQVKKINDLIKELTKYLSSQASQNKG